MTDASPEKTATTSTGSSSSAKRLAVSLGVVVLVIGGGALALSGGDDEPASVSPAKESKRPSTSEYLGDADPLCARLATVLNGQDFGGIAEPVWSGALIEYWGQGVGAAQTILGTMRGLETPKGADRELAEIFDGYDEVLGEMSAIGGYPSNLLNLVSEIQTGVDTANARLEETNELAAEFGFGACESTIVTLPEPGPLAVGDCLQHQGASAELNLGERVPCSAPHQHEIYGLVPLNTSGNACDQAFIDYVGLPYTSSQYRFSGGEFSDALPNTTVCTITSNTEPLVGSVRGSGL